MSRQEWSTLPRYAAARACAHPRRRRRRQSSIFKTNIILKNWITVIVHHRTSTAVRGRIVPSYQHARDVRASASEKLSGLSPRSPRLRHPISPFSLTLAKPRYPTNFSSTSTARAERPPCGRRFVALGKKFSFSSKTVQLRHLIQATKYPALYNKIINCLR